MMSMLIPLALACLLAQDPEKLQPVEELGLRVAPGFKVTLFADSALANDIYAMTLDSRGRVVVTSQGWIKILEDTDGDGKADRATLFAATRTGGMGMCFDGNDLLFSGDNGLWRYRDADGDGKADGPPELISKYVTGEHGHHAIRKGPDGYWYVIGGNDAGIGKQHVTLPDSPVKQPHAGAIVRYTPDFKQSEVIAHGFRNPYDFDFNAWGDLFTYDSDCERDYFLPWYTPTRIYHVGYGMHHGWRLTGYLRSYANRDYYPDTVDMLWPVGRGSPTGVVCYRHTAFPLRYRGGLFALDWTFGRMLFFPLTPSGASYSTKAEVFLEPTGSEGFAPTDLVIAPDGSMFISIGGRRTRGAVFRIEARASGSAGPPDPAMKGFLQEIPQPLDAWSRARWEPAARNMGAAAFEAEVLGDGAVRAVEILTDLFGGLKQMVALRAAGHLQPEARARVAWSLGRKPCEGFAEILLSLAADEHPRVRVAALEALADHPSTIDPARLKAPVLANLGHADKRVRQAAGRLYSHLMTVSDEEILKAGPRALLAATVSVAAGPKTLINALLVLKEAGTADLRRDAIRGIVLGLGDTNLPKPPVEVLSNYSVVAPPDEALRARILSVVRPLFPSGEETTDLELSRLLAMLEDDAPETVARTAAFITERSPATADVHYLAVLSRLRAPWPEGTAARAAHTILSLGTKLERNDQRGKQTWGSRVAEIATLFAKHDPRFVDELLRDPLFIHAGHVGIAATIEGPRRPEIARRFLEAVRKDAGFAWTEPLIGLLSQLPREEFHPALRAQWSNFAMRDSILIHLGSAPDPQDRERFLVGLESANAQAARLSIEALEKLPRDESIRNLVPLLRLLRRLTLEANQATQRKQVADLIARQSGKAFDVTEPGTEPLALKKAYQPVFDAFKSLKGELDAGDAVDVAALLKPVPWEQGDAARGLEIFRARGCQTCHAVQGALGPNLVGAASRFSREDLFEAIANPSKDVAPLYRTTIFQMKDGNVHTGIVAFESADGFIVQTGATTTVRINTPDVAATRPGALSLMPNGLVDGLKPGDLADLYAYLRTLK
jgi:putative membrane-bound dehydrogenase-like protein